MKIQVLTLWLLFIFFFSAASVNPQNGWIMQNISTGNHSLNSVYAVTNDNAFTAGGYNGSSIPYPSYYIYCRTSNAGTNWIIMTSGYGYYVKSLQFIDAQTGYAGAGSYEFASLEDTYGQYILKTTDAGSTWQFKHSLVVTPGFNIDITDIHFTDVNTGWAVSRGSSILKTLNGGQNWTIYYTLPYCRFNGVFFLNTMTGYACGDTGSVFITTNGGSNWTKQTTPSVQNLKSVFFISTATGWAVGSNGTIIKTTNSGGNWINLMSVTSNHLNSIAFVSPSRGWIAGNNIILGTSSSGADWSPQFSGTANLVSVSFADSIHGYACGGNKIYATTTGGWTAIRKTGNELPHEFELSQNYPNPFNSSAKIRFGIPFETKVSLNIFNTLGQKIMVLAEDIYPPGTYETILDLSEFAGGVYYCRLITNEFSQTRKMLYLK